MATSRATRPAAAVAAFEFTASKFEGALLREGDHVVTIEQIERTTAAKSELWNDQTDQLAVKFKNDDGVITGWYNMQGFKTFDELSAAEQKSGLYEPRGDSGYAVKIATGNRVLSPEKTKSAMSIIGQLGTNALNLETGTGFNSADLIGAEVGIHVQRNGQNQLRVGYTMAADKVEA